MLLKNKVLIKILSIFLIKIVSINYIEALQSDFDNFADYFEVQEEYIPVTPCDAVRPGDPDLTTYDIISSYRFDEYNPQYQGVQKIAGSTNYQTAYHIDQYANTTISTSQIFPKGLPTEFSFECTFRRSEIDPQIEWYLFELTDYSFQSQMSVTINEAYNSLVFSLPKYDGSMQTVSFEEIEIFDRSWHKVMLGVTQDSVSLWVDCKPIPHRSGTLLVPLDVRGPIDVTEGIFSVARNCKSRASVPIDLQWMIFSCDSQKPLKASCSELSIQPNYPNYPEVRSTTPQPQPDTTMPPLDLSFITSSTDVPWIFSTTPSGLRGTESHACPIQCPVGPPGPPGPPGIQGLVGPTGTPGVQSANYEITTIKGQKGEPGLDGLHGLDGSKGERGAEGAIGAVGEKGEAGENGQPGPAGPVGLPGPPGPPGLSRRIGSSKQQEATGRTVEDREIREICLAVVREYVNEISTRITGPPGAPGHPGQGRPGSPGHPGPRGEQGPPGQTGERGYPGIGFPGPQGEQGPRGAQGQKGDSGEDGVGIMGPMGPQGPPGNDGRGLDGQPGRPGDQGDAGRPGAPGPQGPQGPPGVCPDCTPYQAAYAYPMYLAQQQQSNKGPPSYYNKGPQNYYNKGP